VQKCVVNTCITEIKKQVKFDYKSLDDGDDKMVVTDVETGIEAKEILLYVQQLPANYSLVFNMYVMEGYNHVEIGKMLNISAGTSKWYLHEARNLLKDKIEQLYCNESKNEKYS
jgi:DNA-directed RNA polymerase specialized sigma24 family protein